MSTPQGRVPRRLVRRLSCIGSMTKGFAIILGVVGVCLGGLSGTATAQVGAPCTVVPFQTSASTTVLVSAPQFTEGARNFIDTQGAITVTAGDFNQSPTTPVFTQSLSTPTRARVVVPLGST